MVEARRPRFGKARHWQTNRASEVPLGLECTVFPATAIAVAMLLAFGTVFPLTFLDRRGHRDTAANLALVAALSAAYCLLAGASMIESWQNPFAASSSATMSSAAGSHGGRGGIVILVIMFWPYALILFGAYFGHAHFTIWRNMRRRNALSRS